MNNESQLSSYENYSKPAEDDTRATEHTKMFFQRPLKFWQASIWIFVQFFSIGLVLGYSHSVTIAIFQKGDLDDATDFRDFISTPFLLRYFFAPVIDCYFLSIYGKSKSYTTIGSGVISLIFFFLGFFIDSILGNKKFDNLTTIYFVINMMVGVIQISGYVSVLTLFSKEDSLKAPVFIVAGHWFGMKVGSEFFWCLNNVEWLNSQFFTVNKRETPLIDHRHVCFFVAMLFACHLVVGLLFVAEEKIIDNQANLRTTFSVVSRFFTNPNTRNFVFYAIACKFFFFMTFPSISYTLQQHEEVNREAMILTPVDLLAKIIILCLVMFALCFTKKGKIVCAFHLSVFLSVFLIYISYHLLVDLIKHNSRSCAFLIGLILDLTKDLDASLIFLLSFFYFFSSKQLGCTTLAMFLILTRETASVPRKLGETLGKTEHFGIFLYTCCSLQVVILSVLIKYALAVDRKESKVFDVSEPEFEELNIE